MIMVQEILHKYMRNMLIHKDDKKLTQKDQYTSSTVNAKKQNLEQWETWLNDIA